MRSAPRTSLANLVPRLARDLDDTRKRAKVDIPAAELTAEEISAIATIKSSLSASAPLTPHQELEVRLFSFRLLLAAPWSARNVMPGHYVASALGKLFDAITASDVGTNARRKVCNTMCLWVERWIDSLAKTRRLAILGARPPRPPPLPPPPPRCLHGK